MSVDLSRTIIPKSDQLNADDLISGPITITITRVRGCDENEQPIAIHYEGDNGKPYKPCKSMRRVLVHAWGAEGTAFVGRSMTLYLDDKVTFGGFQVGGIRISHMSHIDREMVVALTATRAKRVPYSVKPLRTPQKAQEPGASAHRIKPSPEASEPVTDDPGLSFDPLGEMTQDQRVAWVESFRALLMKNAKTAQAQMSCWTEHWPVLERIRDADAVLFERLEKWAGERLARLRAQEAQSGA